MRRSALAAGTAAAALFGALLLAPAPSASASSPAANGAQIFARCAACHTATGAGVPGAFPSLRGDFRAMAAKPAGRRYLALAVIKGLSGAITVDGKPYRGMMPPQGLDDASVAAVLNHIGATIATTGPKFRPFTAAEVAKARAGGATLSSAAVAKLRPATGG